MLERLIVGGCVWGLVLLVKHFLSLFEKGLTIGERIGHVLIGECSRFLYHCSKYTLVYIL